METGVFGDRNKVIQDLFSGLYSVNPKAKMVLELLGFRSAAALPGHLHAALLQLLLMGSGGPFCRRPLDPLATPGTAGHPLPLRSEGCVIHCLFADWLTKTSKWLKVPRYRYVMLLSVEPKPEMEDGQQLVTSNNSNSQPERVVEETPQGRMVETEVSVLRRKHVQKPPPHLLLVTFKAPEELLACDGHESVDSYIMQRAEPSEVFSIDSTHRALCHRVPSGKDTQLVLIVEGLGGRLLVLGEISRSAASPSATGVQASRSSPLEQLAYLINETAPLCAAPPSTRWRRFLQLFAATATAVDLGESAAIQSFGHNVLRQHGKAEEAVTRESESTAGCCQVNRSDPAEACGPVVCGEQQTISLAALLFRLSIAACFVICRPLTLIMRHRYFRFAVSRRSCAVRETTATSTIPGCGCNNCGSDANSHDSLSCTRKGHLCGCMHSAHGARIISGHRTIRRCVARPQRTLRQLIDDQQRSLAALAVRECRRKAALLQHEYQMSRQQASRALMDEQGQLFPQARRWLESTDGKLLMLCLAGRSWRPPTGPRS